MGSSKKYRSSEISDDTTEAVMASLKPNTLFFRDSLRKLLCYLPKLLPCCSISCQLVQQKDVSLENCFDVLSGWSDYYENLLLVSSENLNDTLTQSDSVLRQAR